MLGRLQEGVSEYSGLHKESNIIECSWGDMYMSIRHIKPTALRSVEKKKFKKKTNQHQNKKLRRKGVLDSLVKKNFCW